MFVLDLIICVLMGTYITEKMFGENIIIKTMMIMHVKIESNSITR